ncbi:hypothetical protein J4456_00565 [Candidatus Pacearchaeota archaeon]|nr:hypothetical protein [Candidatus Pacearchaeota archaeon]
MIGRCPNCGIKLKEPPFSERETSEVLITLKYREMVENNIKIFSIEEKGYCEICNAQPDELEAQILNVKDKL